MGRQIQEWLAVVNSEFFPDWAREEISARLDEDTLDLRHLSNIMDEAREDIFDLQALSRDPDVQETYSLGQVKQYFKQYDELHAHDKQKSA